MEKVAKQNSPTKPQGFLVINKPARWTSFDVVAKLRAITGERNIGHTGTLDPFATGVLVIGFNEALGLISIVQSMEKVYRGRIRLGQTSDTDDIDGSKKTVAVASQPTEAQVKAALNKFVGPIKQVPPKYSAVKVAGRRMYELARKGLPIKREPRQVTIYDLKLLAYSYPFIDIEVRVSSGTYIRAIARDVGDDLKTGGFLEELVRHRVGPFTLEDAVEIADVKAKNLPELLQPIETVISDLSQIVLPPHDLERLAHGLEIVPPADVRAFVTKSPSQSSPAQVSPIQASPIAVVTEKGRLLMFVRYDAQTDRIKSTKIFDEKLKR